MISLDANLLLYAINSASPFHEAARRFLEEMSAREDVAVSEFILVEYYVLLRNPAVLRRPLSESQAATQVEVYRRHPRWMLLGFGEDSVEVHARLWHRAGRAPFARRRIFDARTAISLVSQGVTEFATANVKDYRNLGFRRVWNPL